MVVKIEKLKFVNQDVFIVFKSENGSNIWIFFFHFAIKCIAMETHLEHFFISCSSIWLEIRVHKSNLVLVLDFKCNF